MKHLRFVTLYFVNQDMELDCHNQFPPIPTVSSIQSPFPQNGTPALAPPGEAEVKTNIKSPRLRTNPTTFLLFS